MSHRTEYHNLDGNGPRPCDVYDMVPWGADDYWEAVTDVGCPVRGCCGVIRWAEAGYAPGYRICDKCGRHFMAKGTAAAPTLVQIADRRRGFDRRKQPQKGSE